MRLPRHLWTRRYSTSLSPFTRILEIESRLKTVIVRTVRIVAYDKCQPKFVYQFLSTDERFDLWTNERTNELWCVNIYRSEFRATLSTETLNSECSPWTIRTISNFGRPWQNNVPIISHEYIPRFFSYFVFFYGPCVLISYRTINYE